MPARCSSKKRSTSPSTGNCGCGPPSRQGEPLVRAPWSQGPSSSRLSAPGLLRKRAIEPLTKALPSYQPETE